MAERKAVQYEVEIPEVFKALQGVHATMDENGLEPSLHHLVVLRASQINRCGHCVKMHTKEARADGETSDRLDRLVVWDHVNDFNDREKAALAWTEALTVLDNGMDLGALRAQLRQYFSEREISILTATIGMINVWNRIQVSRH
ncbi:MAG: carboxymuconolactone decarboxylase family protein [Rhizobium sp.]|nr:carboxymuconolactone decarboxylase family protein [Rhizobium sp.]